MTWISARGCGLSRYEKYMIGVGGSPNALYKDVRVTVLASASSNPSLDRGVRADEAAPGSGLGLAIARDLAEVYGGSIALTYSPEGGLRARLSLPGA